MSEFVAAAADLVDALMETFGETVTYRGLGHADVSVTAWLRDLASESSVPGNITQCGIRCADLAFTPANGDQVLVGLTAYKVTDEPIADIAGQMWTLHLRKAP